MKKRRCASCKRFEGDPDPLEKETGAVYMPPKAKRCRTCAREYARSRVTDKEAKKLNSMVRMLRSMDEEERGRTMRYLNERFPA